MREMSDRAAHRLTSQGIREEIDAAREYAMSRRDGLVYFCRSADGACGEHWCDGVCLRQFDLVEWL